MSFRARLTALCLVLVGGGATVAAASGQTPNTEHTLALDDPSRPGTATFADLAWLVGSFEGEAFGGRVEETWNPPSAGTMMGMFKLILDDGVSFYEFMLMEREGETTTLKLKHFTDAFVGWEEPDDFIRFPLVRAAPDTLYFHGLTFRREAGGGFTTYLALRQDGVLREETLVFRRR